MNNKGLLSLMQLFVRNGQFLPASLSAGCKYPSAISSGHSFAETMFIASFAGRRLVRSFHILKMEAQRYYLFQYKQFKVEN